MKAQSYVFKHNYWQEKTENYMVDKDKISKKEIIGVYFNKPIISS